MTKRIPLIVLVLFFASELGIGVFAYEEMQERIVPERETFSDYVGFQGQKFFRGEEQLRLHVPKSFEGRSGTEYRQFYGAELFEFVRFERVLGRDQLRGKVSVFDFDYTKDKLDFQLYRSERSRPGKNACMACHAGDYPRLTVKAGLETLTIEPKPATNGSVRFQVADVLQKSHHIGASYWLGHRLVVRADYSKGSIQQGGYDIPAKALKVGAGTMFGNRLAIDGDIILSKTSGFAAKSAVISNAHYRLTKGLRLTVGAGAFLQGSMHYGAPLSEMGATAIGLEKEDSSLLPSLFRKLKSEAYGYVITGFSYDYTF